MTKTTYTLQDGILLPRRQILTGALSLGALSIGFPAIVHSKSLQGVKLNVSLYNADYHRHLRPWLKEFEAATGAQINLDTSSFPVYNQRADLELSTKGSAYDVVNVTFIYSSRWINAGWLTPLDAFLADPNQTPADFDFADFLAGTLAPERGRDGLLYGLPWTSEVTLTAAGRYDLLQQEGLGIPDTVAELETAAQLFTGREPGFGFVTDNHYGWTFPPYLHAFGGDVFRNAPDDVYPTLDSPEAIAAADYFARLIRDYGPDGAVTFSSDQALGSVKAGRTQFITQGQNFVVQLSDKQSSKVASTAGWGHIPAGPAGRFPGTAVQAFGIPVGSRNKEAAWQFIVWANSKANQMRAVKQGYGGPTRQSALSSAAFAQQQNANGFEIGKLAAEALALAAQTGHMKYRTVPAYPQVDLQLNKAIELIVTKQLNAEQAMQRAQAASVAELRRAGAL